MGFSERSNFLHGSELANLTSMQGHYAPFLNFGQEAQTRKAERAEFKALVESAFPYKKTFWESFITGAIISWKLFRPTAQNP